MSNFTHYLITALNNCQSIHVPSDSSVETVSACGQWHVSVAASGVWVVGADTSCHTLALGFRPAPLVVTLKTRLNKFWVNQVNIIQIFTVRFSHHSRIKSAEICQHLPTVALVNNYKIINYNTADHLTTHYYVNRKTSDSRTTLKFMCNKCLMNWQHNTVY